MPPQPYASIFAITSQPEDHILKALTALCADDEVRKKAHMYLMKLARHAKHLKETAAATASPPANGIKRKREDEKTMLDVEICIQCEQPFHKDDNNDKSCSYHEDDLEVDEDSSTWIDWDEDTHGPWDTSYNRKAYPDGFVYVCCGEPARSKDKGCARGKHKPAEDPPEVMKAEIDKLEKARMARIKRMRAMDDGKAKTPLDAQKTAGSAAAATKKVDPQPPAQPKKCIRCRKGFWERGNTEGSCCYHDGVTYPDLDLEVWEDMDIYRDTPVEGMEDDYPEGYRISCCDRVMTEPGCKKGRHVADGEKADGSKTQDGEENKENIHKELIEISDDE